MEQRKHESDLSPKERRKLERSYLSNMTILQKADHILTYYKTHMFFALLTLLGMLFVCYIIYRFQFDTVLNVLVINSQNGNAREMEDDFKAFMGDDDHFHEIFIDHTFLFTGSSLSDRYKEMKLASYIQNEVVDVMIMDEEYYRQYKESELLQPLFKVVSEEEIRSLGLEVREVFGILITGNEKLKKYGLEISGDVYLAVMKNVPHPENAKKFIEFICG